MRHCWNYNTIQVENKTLSYELKLNSEIKPVVLIVEVKKMQPF